MRALTLAIGFALAVIASAHGAVSEQAIGAAAQVVNSVYGSPESTRQSQWLHAGTGVLQNETIVTAEDSASRVVFRDNTQLSIGPTAQVKLDTFVFDPNPTSSAVEISLVKGAFRFTSGSFKENYSIKTPAVAIGLRGTAFTVVILQNGSELISVESGAIFVTCHSGVTVAVNAGQTTYIPTPTGSATLPRPSMPLPAINQLDALLH